MRTNQYTLLLLLLCFCGVAVYAQLGRCKGKYLGNITAYSAHRNYTYYGTRPHLKMDRNGEDVTEVTDNTILGIPI